MDLNLFSGKEMFFVIRFTNKWNGEQGWLSIINEKEVVASEITGDIKIFRTMFAADIAKRSYQKQSSAKVEILSNKMIMELKPKGLKNINDIPEDVFQLTMLSGNGEKQYLHYIRETQTYFFDSKKAGSIIVRREQADSLKEGIERENEGVIVNIEPISK